MKFNFPSNTQLESVNLRIKVTTGNKIRAIAKERNIPITEVYQTIIEEAIEDYRALYPEKTEEVPAKKIFSIKRDVSQAGDNKRDQSEGLDGDGDRRTKESKDNLLASGIWAAGYSECVVCHTTERRHAGRGYCQKCYYQAKTKDNPYPGLAEATIEYEAKKSIDTPIEKLPKDWYKKEVIEKQIPKEEYLYCTNGNCRTDKFGKFLKGNETIRENKPFCSIICADEVYPLRKPLPDNFSVAYCQYLMCDKKKYIQSEGIEAQGKNFCSEKHYADWLESTKGLRQN